MADPYVQKLGSVIDIDGRVVPVGVDYDAVQVGDFRFDIDGQEDFARLFVRASFLAGRHHEQERQREPDPELQRVIDSLRGKLADGTGV